MTNEEAIKIFNTVLLFGKCDLPKEETEECLKMAIEALKKEPEELCDDCISRMSIIQKLSARFGHFVDNVYGSYEKCDKSIRNEISEILADIVLEPPVKPKSAWIPVTERLPKKEDTYLTTIFDKRFKSRFIVTSSYDPSDNEWDPDDGWSSGSDVIAWMPVSAYKSESEVEK